MRALVRMSLPLPSLSEFAVDRNESKSNSECREYELYIIIIRGKSSQSFQVFNNFGPTLVTITVIIFHTKLGSMIYDAGADF